MQLDTFVLNNFYGICISFLRKLFIDAVYIFNWSE